MIVRAAGLVGTPKGMKGPPAIINPVMNPVRGAESTERLTSTKKYIYTV